MAPSLDTLQMAQPAVGRLRQWALLLMLLCVPFTAHAHATPIEQHPGAGANVTAVSEVSITFSERIEEKASRMRILKDDTVIAETMYVDDSNPRRSIVPVSTPLEDGVYLVSWSVVSSDDGHFTKGTYAFAVGSSTAPLAADSMVVPIRSPLEVFTVFVELAGNSLLWGALVASVLIRGIGTVLINRVAILGVIFALSGAAVHVLVKSYELAGVQVEPFTTATLSYVQTFGGTMTLGRMAAVTGVALFFLAFSGRTRLYLSGACLIVFAALRAVMSHATANPFHPELSAVVNVFHLIEKDLWFGLLVVVVTGLLSSGRSHILAALPRINRLLAFNLAAVSLTASYIIWLHLKAFENFASQWGDVVIPLIVAAVILVTLRCFNVLVPRAISAIVPFTLTLEAVAAGFVVFFSSVVILTSPPHGLDTTISRSDTPYVALQYSRSHDSELVLDTSERKEPIVTLGDIAIPLRRYGETAYALPRALLESGGSLRVIIVSDDGYDAHATLAVPPLTVEDESKRPLDFFALGFILLALSGAALGLMLSRVRGAHDAGRIRPHASVTFAVVTGLVVIPILTLAAQSTLGNRFQAQCEADGNAWHMMQPTHAYRTTAATSREGCMLAGGAYHIPDARQYDYLRSLGEAEVALTSEPTALRSGSPQTLTLTFTDAEGNPATLREIHERLIHVIVVSQDMSHFAHIHPDDFAPISEENVRTGVFQVRHEFSTGGTYIIAIDFMHGLVQESRTFIVDVAGPDQGQQRIYTSVAHSGDYTVELDHVNPFAEDLSTLYFNVLKDGEPVRDLSPYLGAAMHIALVKTDLSEFVHGHGEVHPPGTPPPTAVNHVHAPPPPRFGPNIEAHLVFPREGAYTIFGEFMHEGEVVTVRFTTRVR